MSSKKPILLVEDDQDDIFFFTLVMKKTKTLNPLRIAMTGRDAMDYLSGDEHFSDRESNPLPVIIFLDLKIPHVDGFFILEWIRKHPEFAGIPIVTLSGSSNPLDHQKAIDLGALTHLVKPILPEQLQKLMGAL
ncbi:MAG: response regulator [Verrucomicrobiota bacterium]